MHIDEGRLLREGIISFKYLKRNKFSIPDGNWSRTREPVFNYPEEFELFMNVLAIYMYTMVAFEGGVQEIADVHVRVF